VSACSSSSLGGSYLKLNSWFASGLFCEPRRDMRRGVRCGIEDIGRAADEVEHGIDSEAWRNRSRISASPRGHQHQHPQTLYDPRQACISSILINFASKLSKLLPCARTITTRQDEGCAASYSPQKHHVARRRLNLDQVGAHPLRLPTARLRPPSREDLSKSARNDAAAPLQSHCYHCSVRATSPHDTTPEKTARTDMKAAPLRTHLETPCRTSLSP